MINNNMLALLKGDKGDGLDEIVDGTLTAKKAEQDADGKVISSTYATKTEATRSATNTQQGQVKMGSTTNGGVITSGESDDTVPTIKNICDWVKNNRLPSAAPTWVSGTSGSLTLPSAGWYIIYGHYSYSGIVYWAPSDPSGANITVGYAAVNNDIAIATDGTLSLLGQSGGTMYYYKLA